MRDVDLVAEYADIIRIGARNMQNFILLTEVGKAGKPVLLKRAFSATIEETLMAAEYIVKSATRRSSSASGASAPLNLHAEYARYQRRSDA